VHVAIVAVVLLPRCGEERGAYSGDYAKVGRPSSPKNTTMCGRLQLAADENSMLECGGIARNIGRSPGPHPARTGRVLRSR